MLKLRLIMPTHVKTFLLLVTVACSTITSGAPASSPALALAERAYADLNDAAGVIGAMDSGLFQNYDGRDRAAWELIYRESRRRLAAELPKLSPKSLSRSDTRALNIMRSALEAFAENPSGAMQPTADCNHAAKPDANFATLRESLYACFTEFGNNIQFEGQRLPRVAALDLLGQVDDPARRKSLFLAFTPLWRAINADNQPGSPYRRELRLAVAEYAKKGSSPIDAAARTVGASPAEIERWLQQVLDTWRQVSGDQPIEPWDYRYLAGEADRILSSAAPRDALERINQRYYRDLGVDLKQLGILYDLDPRPGKAPLAYTDYVIRGRNLNRNWRPTITRVSASYARGGLGSLNELVHENGHAVHMAALRTRPAFMDLGDAVFYEAFADVPSWSTYEPAWQRRYLGKEAPLAATLRSLYSGVMLDVAWALFELRMLRAPSADPNQLWTDITSRYLHIVPHPEHSWWAVRVQLVHEPGYMVNYGLGSVLTAAMRQRTRQAIGLFDAGNPRWYSWTSQHLLRFGMEQETSTLMRNFLGRAVSPDALISDMRRLALRAMTTPTAGDKPATK